MAKLVWNPGSTAFLPSWSFLTISQAPIQPIPRVATIRRGQIDGMWYGSWQGQADVVVAPTEYLCAMAFALHCGIPYSDFCRTADGKWRHVQVSSELWEIHEVLESAAPVVKREPRVAVIQMLQANAFVGWWQHDAEIKVDGVSRPSVLEQLGPLIGIPGREFIEAVTGLEGWSLKGDYTSTWITEIIPEITGSMPCPDCKGTGKYVGFLEIETCQACGGKAVV